MPEQVFVSYSHKDKDRLDILKNAVDGGMWSKYFQLWTDQRIEVGEKWSPEIRDRIGSARVAVLIESDHFATSDYIAQHELPAILKRYQDGALTIFRLPFDRIPPSLSNELNQIQAAWDPGKAWIRMSDEERREILMTIGNRLIEKVQGLVLRDDLKEKIERILGSDAPLESLGAGEYSIFYKTKQYGGEIAVKALVPSPGREWLSKDFLERAKAVKDVTNSTAIGIRGFIEEKEVQGVVTEYVSAPTLQKLLKNGPLPRALVADVLAQLTRLAAHLSRMEGQPVIGPVQPSHVHYTDTGRARLSLISITNETLKSCEEKPIKLLGPDALTYLSPERYAAQKIDVRTDQYHLGLLALELLEGTPPVKVKKFADLEMKKNFFANPRKCFGPRTSENPALCFVLATMLESDPQRRWPEMLDLFDMFSAIAKNEVPRTIRNHVARDYANNLANNDEFFEAFYDVLFKSAPDIEQLFAGQSKAEQAKKLNSAMINIISFHSNDYIPSLRSEVRSHRALKLKPEHFDHFRDAFVDAVEKIGKADQHTVDAWRAVLEPALAYMRDQVCGHGQQADAATAAASPAVGVASPQAEPHIASAAVAGVASAAAAAEHATTS